LSACNTAFSTPELELSLAGSALKSRVKSVIAATNTINAVSALVLTTLFYDQLKLDTLRNRKQDLRITKAQALRSAQLEMIFKLYTKKNRKFTVDKNSKTVTLNSIPVKIGDYDIPSEEDLTHPQHWSQFILIGNPW
jgi:CHAT domain-containing protein